MPTEEHATAAAPPSLFNRFSLLFRLLVPFGFLLFFAGDLLSTYFSGDDIMNLYKYVERGWSVCRGLFLFWSANYYRPAGGFLYLSLYHLFGMNPAPYKALALLLLVVNLAIALFVARNLLRSTPLAALVILLLAYHAAEAQLYYSFGTIYDIACFTFMYAALGLFIFVRGRGNRPSGAHILILLVLQIAALDAKEMAVSLPLILLLYEALLSPEADKNDFDPHAWIAPVLMGIVVAIYALGKTNSALEQNFLYHPQLSLHKYLESMSYYLDLIFYQKNFFGPKSTAIFLAAGYVIAVGVRSRVMIFGWTWFLIAFLPLNFIPNRAGFVLYIPMLGLAVALAGMYRDFFFRLPHRIHYGRPALLIGPESLLFFLIVALLLYRLDKREKLLADPEEKRPLAINRQFAADLMAQTPNPKPQAHLLFLNDPFPDESWSTLFLPSLLRHDMKLSAARGRMNFLVVSPALLPQYDEIYDYTEPHLTRIQAADVPARLAARRTQQGFVEPGEGIWAAPGAFIWTKRVFRLQAGCGVGEQTCHLMDDIFLPHEAYPATPDHRLTFKVDEGTPQTAALTTNQDVNSIAAVLSGGANHTITYEFDAVVPPAEHPGDPRELGLVLRGARITP
jgi:hypothetical protein